MQGCMPALLSILAVPLASHSCTRAHPYTYTHPVLSPPSPCPTHALVMHISPTSLPRPSPLPYTCNHAYTHIPAPLCMDSCIPPVHSPWSTCPPSFTFTLMATLVPQACDHPQVHTITLMPTSHPICIHPHARTHHISLWFVFFMFYFILLTISFLYTILILILTIIIKFVH